MTYVPINDGVDHINIYSRGKTELGMLLSNFACTSFVLPDDGKFTSVEGYWYWLLTGKQHDRLRHLCGFRAKQIGRELRTIVANVDDAEASQQAEFQEKIKAAISAKLYQTSYLKFLLLGSTLPFTHYYVFDGVRKDAGYEWQVEYWEQLRQQLKKASRGQTKQDQT